MLLLLILLLFIVDCKKLRNSLKKKKGCNGWDAKCGWFRAKCCKPYQCISLFGGIEGNCYWNQLF